MGGSMGVLSYFASGNLYYDALKNLFYAPMRVFDQTPVGRIMGIFGKDVGVLQGSRHIRCNTSDAPPFSYSTPDRHN